MMTRAVTGQDQHGWTGGGRFRLARIDGAVIVRFTGLHTQSGRLGRDIGDFFRKSTLAPRPSFDPFHVRLWMVTAGWRKRIDLDNVAKACLDALTGYLWKDDSQVVKLALEKVEGPTEAIILEARAVNAVQTGEGLQALLDAIEDLKP